MSRSSDVQALVRQTISRCCCVRTHAVDIFSELLCCITHGKDLHSLVQQIVVPPKLWGGEWCQQAYCSISFFDSLVSCLKLNKLSLLQYTDVLGQCMCICLDQSLATKTHTMHVLQDQPTQAPICRCWLALQLPLTATSRPAHGAMHVGESRMQQHMQQTF